MLKKFTILSILSVASACLSNAAHSTSINNGNFASDLSGWSTVSNGGSVQWDVSGQAKITTGSGVAPFSAVLVQGDDGSFTFTNPILLSTGADLFKFDAVFSTAVDSSETAPFSGFRDNLQVWLYDANTTGGTKDALIANINASSIVSTYSFDLTSYSGQSVSFSFELNDENDGSDAQVLLDNIRIESKTNPNPVPLPSTLMLSSTLLLMTIGRRAFKRIYLRQS